VAWKSQRQGVRGYSTCQVEYIAGSDTLVVEEQQGYLDFFSDKCINGAPLWCDNQSAIAVAKNPDVLPKSRHYALRWCRVRDEARRLFFAPTTLQKADALTKQVPTPVRNMIFYHNVDQSKKVVFNNEDDPDNEIFQSYFISVDMV
jgi:hypothetical protein